MKSLLAALFLVLALALAMVGCTESTTPTAIPSESMVVPPSLTAELPPTPVPPSPTTEPDGKTIIVDNPADSGSGTLRQALENAQPYDTISFDPTVFPPNSPETINVESELPHISQGFLTVDASDAGVILDGSLLPADSWIAGLQMVSDGNVILGMQVINFTGAGIAISESRQNTVGGDRAIGAGPTGQANQSSGNDFGIGIWNLASDNVVTGNLLGTDPSGTREVGNLRSGVWVTEGATENVIGPNNIIAYNDGCGIVIDDPGSFREMYGNRLTQNSIHDNRLTGICQYAGRGRSVPTPVIIEFDLSSGSVSGTSCSNCKVEIFSSNDEEGEFFEGVAITNESGYFSLQKGILFSGSHLAATTIDVDGSTSDFSLSTFGEARSITLQLGNDLSLTNFQPQQSADLADNRIGVQFDSFGYPESYDLGVYARGVKRARVAIAGLEPELVDWEKPEFSIDPSHDEVFTRMADNGLTITYVLTFWDKETYPHGEGAPCARFKTEGEIERYLEFVRFIVNHFKDRVQYYEMWNEPDIKGYCPKYIEPSDYINLVKRTVPVIRQEYPEAKIVVGGVSNLRFSGAPEYLFDLLNSDIMPLVDVVSWHPMYGTSPEYDEYRDYYYRYPSLVQEIKDVATAHGFNGEYQADEIGWATPETAVPDQPWVYSPIVAAKYFGRGILLHLGMDIGVGVPDDNDVVRNLSTLMASAQSVNLPLQIESAATNIVSYTFSLPNGDNLIALWTDGVAVEDDPGTEATLTIPNFSADEVAAIDVLYGFEQQLLTNTENGNLIIGDLLVRDYPIVLRISGVGSP